VLGLSALSGDDQSAGLGNSVVLIAGQLPSDPLALIRSARHRRTDIF
jgi:hypothetical protein